MAHVEEKGKPAGRQKSLCGQERIRKLKDTVYIEVANCDLKEVQEMIDLAENETMMLAVENRAEERIENLIHVVRGEQVMLDSDLAMLYNVETKRLNESVKRNSKRFPENYCFRLTEEEYIVLRSQFATSNIETENNLSKGGRRYLPYAFTEQGIAMLSAILRSDEAIQVSLNIMNTFVKMRRFLAENALMFERLSSLELKQLEYQKESNEKFDKIFAYISEHEEINQRIFFEGQIYDAFSLLVSLIEKAEKSIVLIDNYVDVGTLNILAKKRKVVVVTVYTARKTKLATQDIDKFNAQYPVLKVNYTGVFHDRFLIIDDVAAYHIGASLKDYDKRMNEQSVNITLLCSIILRFNLIFLF